MAYFAQWLARRRICSVPIPSAPSHSLSITPIRASRVASFGFTLLEMLVVLALIAVVAGLAIPNFGNMLDRFSAATTWREVEAEIGDLPYRVFSSGVMVQLDPQNVRDYLKSVPADWQVTLVTPIRYRETGWCDGGSLAITASDGAKRKYVLVAPRCEARAE